MAEFNVQAYADRTRYLQQVQGMSAEEAEKKVFSEAGLRNGAQDIPENAYSEFQRLMSNPTVDSEFARNDGERILNRAEAGAGARYDLNPQEETTQTDATPENQG